ncbi:MAG: hypothetical protein K8U03_26490 [Planctomycetia bacterium]|nr:hypothetical protein [Planctomycetia bacterium]
MDFEVVKSTRTCAVSGREIAAGETYYTVLMKDGAMVKRLDYSAASWNGPPEDAIGWWKSTMPAREGSKKQKLAPSEVMLQLFAELEDSPEQYDLRYVLTLLLIRRRLMRLEETVKEDDTGVAGETMVLYCPRDEQTYRVRVVDPSEPRVAEIQAYLGQLLYAPS